MANAINKYGEKVSSLLDRDVFKAFKQIQLDKDLRSLSEAMRYVLDERNKSK